MTRAYTRCARSVASVFFAGAAGLASVGAVPALAQPPIFVPYEALPSLKVSYADLDVARATDVSRLRVRVRMAAHSVCFDSTRNPLAIETVDHACYSIAIRRADRDIDAVVAEKAAGASITAAMQSIVVQLS